jgi:hypothetical protein
MKIKIVTSIIIIVYVLMLQLHAATQTDQDAIMMSQHVLCTGAMYQISSWNDYWEGSFKRNNENLGTVIYQSTSLMGNYGLTHNLNLICNLPYVQTKASAGVLSGLEGLQDLSIWAKWCFLHDSIGKGSLTLFGLGGLSVPTHNYVADYLPLSIGLKSRTLSGRLIADYQLGNWFATTSGTFTYRNNIKLDRYAYYTTSLHLTNEVEMPNVAQFQLRTGYRSRYLIAEGLIHQNKTLGGFDIRKNDMPFPSNRMNSLQAAVAFKYTPKYYHHFSLIANAAYVLQGRNVGQSFTWGTGLFYAFHVNGQGRKMGRKNYTPPPDMN